MRKRGGKSYYGPGRFVAPIGTCPFCSTDATVKRGAMRDKKAVRFPSSPLGGLPASVERGITMTSHELGWDKPGRALGLCLSQRFAWNLGLLPAQVTVDLGDRVLVDGLELYFVLAAWGLTLAPDVPVLLCCLADGAGVVAIASTNDYTKASRAAGGPIGASTSTTELMQRVRLALEENTWVPLKRIKLDTLKKQPLRCQLTPSNNVQVKLEATQIATGATVPVPAAQRRLRLPQGTGTTFRFDPTRPPAQPRLPGSGSNPGRKSHCGGSSETPALDHLPLPEYQPAPAVEPRAQEEARVEEDAQVEGDAQVQEQAPVQEQPQVQGDARVGEEPRVGEEARVEEDARVEEGAQVQEQAPVQEQVQAQGAQEEAKVCNRSNFAMLLVYFAEFYSDFFRYINDLFLSFFYV